MGSKIACALQLDTKQATFAALELRTVRCSVIAITKWQPVFVTVAMLFVHFGLDYDLEQYFRPMNFRRNNQFREISCYSAPYAYAASVSGAVPSSLFAHSAGNALLPILQVQCRVL